MNYKYTIVQENVNDKNKVSYEFTATDEDEFVDNITSFMNMVGWIDNGNLEIVYEDDYESEVDYTYDTASLTPEAESFKNFEFPLHDEGKGQMEYTFISDDMDSVVDKCQSLSSTWPFPADRPSQPTYRVDSIYTTNDNKPSNNSNTLSYYGE